MRQLADSAGGRGHEHIQRLAANGGDPYRVTLRAEDRHARNGSKNGRIEFHYEAPGRNELRRWGRDFDLGPSAGGSGFGRDLKGEIGGRERAGEEREKDELGWNDAARDAPRS